MAGKIVQAAIAADRIAKAVIVVDKVVAATVADKIAKVVIAVDKVVAATVVDKVVVKAATQSHTLRNHSATNLNLSTAQRTHYGCL